MNLEFLKKNNINKIELTSPHSVTIPGAVASWVKLNHDYGRLPLKDVLNIGVAANDKFGNTFVKRFKIKNSTKAIFY